MSVPTYDELLRENSLLRRALNSSPNIMMVKDFDSKFVFVNDALATLYGTVPENMIGKDDGDFNPNSEQVEFYRQNCKEIMLSGEPCVVFESSTDVSSGKTTHYKSVKVPFLDGDNLNKLLVIASDITDIVQSKALIEEKAKTLDYVFGSLHEGIWDWNIATGHLEHNSTWFSVVGYKEVELSKTLDDFKMVLHKDDIDKVFERVNEALSKGVQYVSEHRLVKKDGSVVWVRDRGTVVELDESGKPARMVGSFLDISDKKVAEQELLNLNESLNTKVQEALEEIRAKDTQLIMQSRLATMGEMIGNIAHQWRQPLNTLAFIVQSLPYALDGSENDMTIANNTSEEAMKLIKYMSQTIDDFRNFFRPDNQKEHFDIKESIQKANSLIAPTMKSENIEVAINMCEDELMFYGYAGGFSQVLLNILKNAKDELREKPSSLQKKIVIDASKQNDSIIVSISDNAGGIDEHIIDRIFEPYFTTKDKNQGTGIGLYMSKMIIEQHMGGELFAQNIDGGARFIVKIKA